jgi:1-acyl-sn-glycerol-3-phosphate acyltransferase
MSEKPTSSNEQPRDLESGSQNEPVLGEHLKHEKGPVLESEKPEDVQKLIEELRSGIVENMDSMEPVKTETISPELKRQRIEEYQKRYLPDYLSGRKGSISKAITGLWTATGGKFEKEGKENIPEKGPFLVICNHFGGGDVQAILKTFSDNNPHFAVAKEMWWNNSTISRFFLKKMGMIPVEESLSNISNQEKEKALTRQGSNGKKVFRKIIDREEQGKISNNMDFVKQAVAVLSKGDALCVFPEGLWLRPEGLGVQSREHKEMKQGYRGIELIASQYKKLTGEELPIIPTTFVEEENGNKKLIISDSVDLSENNTDLNGTDWCMAKVAKMLPENQRGYYKNIT